MHSDTTEHEMSSYRGASMQHAAVSGASCARVLEVHTSEVRLGIRRRLI